MLGSIKSQLQLYEESVKDALQAIRLFKYITTKDNNYYITLASAYYNCASGYQNLFQHSQSVKFFIKAKQIAVENLGPTHILTIYLNKKQETSIDKYLEKPVEINNIKSFIGNRLIPIHNRSKSSINNEKIQSAHKFYKKFKKKTKSPQSESYLSEKAQNK